MVAKFPFVPPKADSAAMDDYYNLPRLFGRAQVQPPPHEEAIYWAGYVESRLLSLGVCLHWPPLFPDAPCLCVWLCVPL